jgi:hypothetical protein
MDAADAPPTARQSGGCRRARGLQKKLESEVAAVQAAHPQAAVEVWATDEHRIGLKPIVRRVWAPRGKRPVVELHPRYHWRYLSGFVHPTSGRTHWHLSSSINVELFASSLRYFAQQAGAGPDNELVLLLDGAGWHVSRRLEVPAHLHLVRLPPYSPELQPAERLWSFSNTPLVNARPADLETLDTLQLDRCAALQTEPVLVAAIQSATHYHWWPTDYSPRT